jgi:hypothetical protein
MIVMEAALLKFATRDHFSWPGFSSTGTLACAGFAIVVASGPLRLKLTKAHSQPLAGARDKEWLCYSMAFASNRRRRMYF